VPHKRIAKEGIMVDDHARIVQLEAQVAALLAERRPRPRRRLPRRFLPLALVALFVLLTPLSLLAAAPFNDLTGGVHDANIGLLYDAGITKGCVPNVSYCPTANVTREEMASFLARTAGLGGNPPVANAKTAQTAELATNATNAANAQTAVTAQTATNATNATTATTATNAGNAAQLGGVAAANYVQTNNRLLPIAFATVSATGVKLSGTSNVSVRKSGSGIYYVTITGESYINSRYTTVVTLLEPGEVYTSSVGTDLFVVTANSTGAPSDRPFQFVVYKP